MNNIIGVRELRENLDQVTKRISKGESIVLMKKNKPLFKMVPLSEDETWETVIDFTRIKRGGVDIDDVLSRL